MARKGKRPPCSYARAVWSVLSEAPGLSSQLRVRLPGSCCPLIVNHTGFGRGSNVLSAPALSLPKAGAPQNYIFELVL